MWPQNFHSGHVLGVAAFFAPIMGVFAPNLITPLTLLALLGLLIQRAVRHDTAVRSDRPLLLIVGLLAVWMLISVSWTPYEDGAFTKCLSVVAVAALATGTLVLAPALAEHERHALRRFALAGIGVALLLFFFEMGTEGAISQDLLGKVPFKNNAITMFNLTSSVLFLFVWPSVAILWRSWPPIAIGLLAICFFAAWLLPSASALIGFTIGTVFFVASLLSRRGARIFVAATLGIAIVIAPFLPRIAPALDPVAIRESSGTHNASLLHRLDIWAFAIDKIEMHPLAGWGFNASRAMPGGNEHYFLRDRSGNIVGHGNRLPLHPHNGALQAWLELGVPGALGFAALYILAALRTARQTDDAAAAAALGAIATAAPIWFLSFGIWQTWWLSVLILNAVIAVALVAPNRT